MTTLLNKIQSVSRNLTIKQKILLSFYSVFVFLIFAFITSLNQQRITESLTQEVVSEQIPHIRLMLDIIIDLEQLSSNITQYLLTDKIEYFNKLNNINEHLIADFSYLENIKNTHKHKHKHKHNYSYDKLLTDWKLFENNLAHLFVISNDPVRRYPGIAAAAEKLYPLNQLFDNTIELLINDINEEDSKSEVDEVKYALYNLRYKWSRFVNSFRIYMTTRSPNDHQNMKVYRRAVENEFKIFKKSFIKHSELIDFFMPNINIINKTLGEYFSRLDNVVKLFETDEWRSDVSYYNTNIIPFIANIKDELNNFVNAEVKLANTTSTNLINANNTQTRLIFALMLLMFVAVFYISSLLSRHITDRLKLLMAATHKASAGNLEVNFKLKGNDELTQLGRDFLIMTKTIKDKSRELHNQKIALDHHDIVSITDPAGLITYVNDKFCQISGYKLTELLHKNHHIVNSGYHDKAFWKDLWRTIGRGHVWHGEVRNKNKEGDFYWVNTTIVPFLDESNKPYQYVSMRTDITAVKNSEAELLTLNNELETRVQERTKAVETAMYGLENALHDVDREKQAIKAIATGTTVNIDEDFYRSLVKNTAKAVEMDYAILVTYYDIDKSKGHVKSMWEKDHFNASFDYDLRGTPCEHLAGKKALVIKDKVAEQFPDDLMLKPMDVKSYIGVPFVDSNNKPLGHLLVMGKSPLTNPEHNLELLKIFSIRAGSEIERQRINELLELRLEQQASAAQLGQLALVKTSLDDLFATVSFVISASLNVGFAKILQYREQTNDFLLVAGVGWDNSLIGRAIIPNHYQSQAGYTLDQEEVVIVTDFSTETRFEKAKLLKDHNISSGMSTVIANTKGPYGIISVHSKSPRLFTEDDARFLSSVSQILTMAIARFKAEQYAEHELKTQHTISELLKLALLQVPLIEQLEKALNIILSSSIFNEKTMACILLFDEHSQNLKPVSQQGLPESCAEQLSELPLEQFFNKKPEINQEIIVTGGDKNKLNINLDQLNDFTEYSIPIKIGSKILGVLTIYMDSTFIHKKQDDDVFITLSNTLAGIIERKNAENSLAEAYRHKSEFLANMSHELRTPLNSIIGFSKTMLKGIDGPITEDQDESLSYIHRSGQHLLSLIGDILDMSKLEAKRMELYYSDVDMPLLIDDIVKTIGVLANEKHLTINVDIEKDLPLIPCDETRIKQVLLNIASNAVKFTETGSIDFKISIISGENVALANDIAELIEQSDSPFLLVSIKDTGIGVAKEDIHKIFEEFRQADNSSTRKHSGTGLGMSISKRLVEMHGGDMWMESSVGKGSSFNFILPIQQYVSQKNNEQIS